MFPCVALSTGPWWRCTPAATLAFTHACAPSQNGVYALFSAWVLVFFCRSKCHAYLRSIMQCHGAVEAYTRRSCGSLLGFAHTLESTKQMLWFGR